MPVMTLQEAIDHLYDLLSTHDLQHLRECGPVACHHGLGTYVRNTMHLWNRDSLLARHFVDVYGLGHADDASSLILNGLYHKLIGEPYDPFPDVQEFKEHWDRMGIDPVTLRSL